MSFFNRQNLLKASHQSLNKCNRKPYALQKQQRSIQDVLDTTPRDIFRRKERKALGERIAGIGRQINLSRTQMEAISKQHGFDDVKSAEAAYKAAKAKLKSLKETLGDTEKEEFNITKQESPHPLVGGGKNCKKSFLKRNRTLVRLREVCYNRISRKVRKSRSYEKS